MTKVAAVGRIEKNLFYMFLAAAILLLASYLYFWERSVVNIVAREAAADEISDLSTAVAAMEAEALALSGQKITPDHAKSLGFTDAAADQNYTVRANKTVSLSALSNEIQ